MIALSLECIEDEAELVSAELWERGAAGIEEETLPGGRTRLRAWFDTREGLEEQFRAYAPSLAEEPPRDWEQESRQAWAPFAVGERWWLAPEWDESPAPRGRLRLTVHPGMALGTGAHPATQLCLRALERGIVAGERVLDVGTGSGILLSAAALLGARAPAGCDIDLVSVHIAAANLARDGVAALVFAGSMRAVAIGAVDTVVANINATTHEVLAAEYTRVARRRAILSGYPARHARRVVDAMAARQWVVAEALEQEDWLCHVFMPGAGS
jgi:ribosomal protein L11 methyltransferase